MDDQRTHSRQDRIIREIYNDRNLARRIIFPHRHKNVDAPFHAEMLALLLSKQRYTALEAFRGAAKSTTLEEAIIMGAIFKDFKFPIIIGNSFDRACERLTAIKREIENNDAIAELFGDLKGQTWAEDRIMLANGVRIQAFGARQSLRGAKHEDQRPDKAFVDDLEDEEMVATEDSRRKLKRWFNGALLPALDPQGSIVLIGTPLHPQALIEEKIKDPTWHGRKFPILYLDEDGIERSTWPDRFSIDFINDIRRGYVNDGNFVEFEQEYMCRSEDAAAKPFQANMIRVQQVAHKFLPIQIMVDPARTTKKDTSARTGYAVWAWEGTKLRVLDAFGAFHKPDEIIRTVFELNEKYNPVEIGVELDGLEEFLMQPLRAETLRRGVSIPLAPQRAPRDKDGFISGLQPFYLAGDVIHADNFPDLTSELLQFPTGRKDVPNALAYALKMRGGSPVYEDFAMRHIMPDLPCEQRHPRYLVMSSRPAMTTAVLVQFKGGTLRVIKDWVADAPPMDAVENIIQEAIMAASGTFSTAAPAEQFDKFTNNGLVAALRRFGHIPTRLPAAAVSQGSLAPYLRGQKGGSEMFGVSDAARWVLNGLSRGYCRKLTPSGTLADQPADNQYRVVMEGLEAFGGWLEASNSVGDMDAGRRYDYSPQGRRFLTSNPAR